MAAIVIVNTGRRYLTLNTEWKIMPEYEITTCQVMCSSFRTDTGIMYNTSFFDLAKWPTHSMQFGCGIIVVITY